VEILTLQIQVTAGSQSNL